MGDARFTPLYAYVKEAANRMEALRALTDEQVIAALAEASRQSDPLFANVLATEAQNRVERARRVIDAVTDAVVAVDRAGNVAFLNPAAERALGWLLSEVQGRTLAEVVPIADRQTKRDLDAALRAGRSTRFEAQGVTTRRGRSLVMTLGVSPIVHAGEVAGGVIIFRSEAGGGAPIQLDASGRIVSAGRAAEVIFGVGSASLAGRPLADLVASRYGGLVNEATKAAMAPDGSTEGTIALDLKGRRDGGREFPLHLTFTPAGAGVAVHARDREADAA